MKKLSLCFLLVLLGSGFTLSSAFAQDVVHVLGDSLLTMTRAEGTLKLPYFSNHPIGIPDPKIRRLILVVHGTLRNADSYYQSILDAANLADLDGWEESTLVVAPQFLTEEDIIQHDLGAQYAFWRYMGWRQGDLSRTTSSHNRPWRISSFAVADTIIARAMTTFANLENVVVAGHSAGGQFANRFTASSNIHSELESRNIRIRSIVSNPSTYLYLSPKRKNTSGKFVVPDPGQISICPQYDNYKYGLNNPNSYMDQGSEVLRQHYRKRNVIYLLGELDTFADIYLDVSCPANFQGPHRLERGRRYIQHLVDEFGAEIRSNHHEVIIAGVGHNHGAIFASACGVRYLFDEGICHDATPLCQVQPNPIEASLDPGGSSNATLEVANSGEPGSLLNFELEMTDPVPLPDEDTGKNRISFRNLDGSTISASPSQYEPGGTLEVTLTVTNHSSDYEFISQIQMNFPSGISILSASGLNSGMGYPIPYSGQLGDGATATWNQAFLEVNSPGAATMVLEFTSPAGNMVVPWQLAGDDFNGPPHTLAGEIVFEPQGPFVQLLSPNGGETSRQGDHFPIQFSTGGGVDTVDIHWRRNGEPWVPLILGIPADGSPADWAVSGDLGSGYCFRIQDAENHALSDTCDARFNIGRSLAWVRPNIFQGSLEAGESTSINLALSAEGLSPGTYRAEVLFRPNFGSNQVVPVTLTVNQAASPVEQISQPNPGIRLAAAPNPFNPLTNLSVEMGQAGSVNLAIFDARGRLVKRLVERTLPAGSHTFSWNGRGENGEQLPSGVYLARLRCSEGEAFRKLLLVR